jgi:hypothetical protein
MSTFTPEKFFSTYFREVYNPDYFDYNGNIRSECNCFDGHNETTVCPWYSYTDLMTKLRSIRERYRLARGLEPYKFMPEPSEFVPDKILRQFDFDFMTFVPAEEEDAEFAIYVEKSS